MSKPAPRNQFHSSESDSINSKQHVSGSLAAEYDLPKSEYVCFFDIQKGPATSHVLSFLQVTGMASSTGTSVHGTTIP